MVELDQRSRVPIYEQIIMGITRLSLCGLMTPNEQLPSVRTLAMQLAVNPNTVQKAYQMLEEQGTIYSIPGKGSFVSPKARPTKQMTAEYQRRISALLTEAAQMGFGYQDVLGIADSIYSKRGELDDRGKRTDEKV